MPGFMRSRRPVGSYTYTAPTGPFKKQKLWLRFRRAELADLRMKLVRSIPEPKCPGCRTPVDHDGSCPMRCPAGGLPPNSIYRKIRKLTGW